MLDSLLSKGEFLLNGAPGQVAVSLHGAGLISRRKPAIKQFLVRLFSHFVFEIFMATSESHEPAVISRYFTG
ncbi:MAG: hypothetical protein ACK5MQ_00980 [Pikeienuella sp.]